ncbi:Uncharacterised protein [Vibrio cholerae]|nr:Uncharacterised protein [Vibrio cholerae]
MVSDVIWLTISFSSRVFVIDFFNISVISSFRISLCLSFEHLPVWTHRKSANEFELYKPPPKLGTSLQPVDIMLPWLSSIAAPTCLDKHADLRAAE